MSAQGTPFNWQTMETAPRDGTAILVWICPYDDWSGRPGCVFQARWNVFGDEWSFLSQTGFADVDMKAWAPFPDGPSFGRGVQQ